jgi:hypothetical protein
VRRDKSNGSVIDGSNSQESAAGAMGRDGAEGLLAAVAELTAKSGSADVAETGRRSPFAPVASLALRSDKELTETLGAPMAEFRTRSWADLRLFLIGPVGLTALVLVWFHFQPPPFPHPSQAQSLTLASLAPLLGLGALGVFLSSRAGLGGAGPRPATAFASALFGTLVGMGLLFADRKLGLSAALAHKLGVASIHMAFPASIGGYLAGATAVECLYRLAPIPILLWLISTLILRGRGRSAIFWVLALLTSAAEPLTQTAAFRDRPDILYPLAGALYLINLFEAELLRRWGWTAPWIFRLALYGAWHVAGPLSSGLA